jgi:N-acetylmuramoyl-L-alanine amidase
MTRFQKKGHGMDTPTLQDILSAENAPVAVQTATFHGSSGFLIQPSKNHPNRNHWTPGEHREIQYLVMHYTARPTQTTVQVFTKNTKDNRTSAHYVIAQKEQDLNPKHTMPEADIIRVVDEANIAWHAGLSRWRHHGLLNDTSIGIEHVSPGFTVPSQAIANWSPFGFEEDATGTKWYHFDPDQMRKSVALAQGIVEAFNIHPTHVLGHADIAPGRKMDPGPLFPWGEFAEVGVGAWLTKAEQENARELVPEELSTELFLTQLQTYGYPVSPGKRWDDAQNRGAFKAFKAHFSGNGDLAHYVKDDLTERDALWIWGLNDKYKKS